MATHWEGISNEHKFKKATAREKTRRIRLGSVEIGGGARVSVQTMATTDTRDADASARFAREAAEAGCDIVRFAVPDMLAAEALAKIKRAAPDVALVADIHFDWRLALASLEAGVDGLRLNPGNIGGAERVREVARAAKARGVPIRVGVNGGSLEADILAKYGGGGSPGRLTVPPPEALVESAMRHVALLEAEDFRDIKVSVKASDVARTVAAYRLLAERTDCPLHLGLTEAGTFVAGTVRSSVAMGILLAEGIGDTIRVSLTDSPLREIAVGLELLRCLGLRDGGANVTSCPTCGRTQTDVIATAAAAEAALGKFYRENPGFHARPRVAIMGCVVNGPGEAKDADLALVGGVDEFLLYVKGTLVSRHPAAEAVNVLIAQLRNFAISQPD